MQRYRRGCNACYASKTHFSRGDDGGGHGQGGSNIQGGFEQGSMMLALLTVRETATAVSHREALSEAFQCL